MSTTSRTGSNPNSQPSGDDEPRRPIKCERYCVCRCNTSMCACHETFPTPVRSAR